MALRGGKRPTHSRPAEAAPASPFRWPSRRRADDAERAARRAAQAGLERLRAHTPRTSPMPALTEVQAFEPDAAQVYEPPAFDEEEPEAVAAEEPEAVHAEDLDAEAAEEVEALPEPPPENPGPAPAPWDADLDELTERLVTELRRDLGPEPSSE